VALSRRANRLTLGARVFLAHVLRATNAAFGLFAVDRAFGTFRLLTLHFTFGTSADGVANGRAARVVALPAAHRVAILFLSSRLVRIGFGFRIGFHFNLGIEFRLRTGVDRSRGIDFHLRGLLYLFKLQLGRMGWLEFLHRGGCCLHHLEQQLRMGWLDLNL